MTEMHQLRLLLFNLATDADAASLGFTTRWINALAVHCESIDVITMRIGRLAVASNVRVWSVGKEKGYSELHRAVEFYRILGKLLSTTRYDACFAHMNPLFAVMAWPLLKLHRVAITLWYAHKSVTWKLRVAEKVVTRVVTPSPESFRINSAKTIILGHGIDTNVFKPMPKVHHADRGFRIISIGRIAPVKHPEVLIEAIKILSADGVTNLQLHLIGSILPKDKPYAAGLDELVAKYHLAAIVKFVPHVPFEEIASQYQHADTMVNLSATGSVDKAVLEAMSCGLPVITSNEAFNGILGNWADTLLVPADRADILATRLKQLIDMTPQARSDLGLRLRHEVEENHNLAKLTEILISLFASDSQRTHMD